MNKKLLKLIICLALFTGSCNDDFLNVSPNDSITDDAVWSTASATKMFVNDVYNSTLSGPLYSFVALNNYQFDYVFTDDEGMDNTSYNEFNFTASNPPIDRWNACYTNIRKANLGIEKITGSTVISENEKSRFLGDLHFLRGLLYFELFRFYGGVPIITVALDRNEDDISYSRNTADETLQFIVDEFQKAADNLPGALDAAEYGRATKGAALGMKAAAYLHGAGTVDAKYHMDAASTANILIDGDLKGRYDLFGRNETDPLKKREAFINLFLEPYEGNEEVIFDVQYAYPYKTTGYQTVVGPGVPGPGHAYGWGFSAPSQNLVDAFEMADGNSFDWNKPEQANNPYTDRDQRLYGTVLYHGVFWKGATLSLSSNRFDNGVEVTNNLPNGLFSTKTERTKTGYYIRKHQNEPVILGYDNRGSGIGGGHNLIVLRYAEILLTYAEAQNEASGPDISVYNAINQVRKRAGQPDLPTGLSQAEMRKRIRNERRVELAFENKRFFDIIRWRAGEEYLNQPFMGMNARYVKNNTTGEIKLTYSKFKVFDKKFSAPTNYLLPIPQSALNRNSNLVQNPGW